VARSTGNAALTVLRAYPDVHVTLLDENPGLLSIARETVERLTIDVAALQATLSTDGVPLDGGRI
jgi:ubiquinone/menaquinone biosynthesis C-methylase UbiE